MVTAAIVTIPFAGLALTPLAMYAGAGLARHHRHHRAAQTAAHQAELAAIDEWLEQIRRTA